ncbi:hypothetical protein MOO45_05975 [Bombilactobacillus folatiphilus]|uniref:Integral membrane protein n=1 Tax=Bombilactobacillus folatiphilus TaxID=2923362 RepID=A0ABY4P7R3_9LACO|nr:hypothetical protein [Bombilactobacillus folatiphilus]UQS81748.1 hypothetical protein MOO45_05975 [Bombilactobacillus folatiphilus]
MSNKKITIIYTFLFIIPYLLCLALIGTGYDALVNHYNSWWRLIICAVIGAVLMIAVKSIAHRPIKIITQQTTNRYLKKVINFFNIDYSMTNFYLNFVIDFVMTIVSTKIIHRLFELYQIQGSLMGWIIALLVLSLVLASNIEYNSLSIDPQQK